MADPPASCLLDELAKVQRQLRRLTLAAEQHGGLLEGCTAKLTAIDQRLIERAAAPREGVKLRESALLEALDQLEQARGYPGMPAEASALVDGVVAALARGAGLHPVARLGSDAHQDRLSVAEVIDEPGARDFRVARIIRQGYVRTDGSCAREAVVVVSGPRALTADGAAP